VGGLRHPPGAADRTSLKNTLFPLHIAEPIDAPKLSGGIGIELQFFGRPFEQFPPSRIRAWTPNMPAEIASVEYLEKKINVLRMLTDGKSLMGAAITPTVVYDDIRMLADCGFDYVCLLLDVVPGLSQGSVLDLGSIELCLEPALKAIRDSGSKIQLWLACNTVDPSELYKLIQNGVNAVCIDSYLMSVRPNEAEPIKDRYASVLSMASSQGSPFLWIKPAVENMGMQFDDYRIYHG